MRRVVEGITEKSDGRIARKEMTQTRSRTRKAKEPVERIQETTREPLKFTVTRKRNSKTIPIRPAMKNAPLMDQESDNIDTDQSNIEDLGSDDSAEFS